jgi:hypothetical protein
LPEPSTAPFIESFKRVTRSPRSIVISLLTSKCDRGIESGEQEENPVSHKQPEQMTGFARSNQVSESNLDLILLSIGRSLASGGW